MENWRVAIRRRSSLCWQTRTRSGANLDRIQIVKGWLDAERRARERVYNVSWSDERQLDAAGALPAVGNTVDMATGQVSNSIGAPQLSARWSDPDYVAGQAAFYYVRVLQIPTARHSYLDALALGRARRRITPIPFRSGPTLRRSG